MYCNTKKQVLRKVVQMLGSVVLLSFCMCGNLFDKLNEAENPDVTEFESDCRTVPMYAQLPAPLSITQSTDLGSMARSLASTVMTGDTLEVLPALERVMLEGGVGIRNSATGALMFSDQLKGNSGICLMDWELNCLARTTVSGVVMTLGDVAALIGFSDIGLDSVKALTLLYDGLQNGIVSQDTGLMVRSQFVNTLSSSQPPYNAIIRAGVPMNGNAPVTQLQAALLMLQFATDLCRFMEINKTTVRGQEVAMKFTSDCAFDDAASTIMDWTAFGVTFGYGKVLEYLEGAGMASAGNYAKVSGAVSAVLALIKYLATSGAMETTLDVEDGEPLVRTVSTQPGQRKILRATAKFDIGNWSYLNCARLALNAANTDFNLPNSGPIAGAAVTWSLNIGSTDFGTNVIENSIVQFYSLDGTSIAHMKTDENGMTRIGLEGAKQSHDLESPLTPIMKMARVEVRIAVSSQKLMSDILSGLGAVTSGPFAALTIPLEIMSRIPLQGRARNVSVQDWEEYQY